jgi:hypothetical protein
MPIPPLRIFRSHVREWTDSATSGCLGGYASSGCKINKKFALFERTHRQTHTSGTAKTRAKAQDKRLKKSAEELQGHTHRHTHTPAQPLTQWKYDCNERHQSSCAAGLPLMA